MEFKKGKKVRVIGNTNGHSYEIGSIVTMDYQWSDDKFKAKEVVNGGKYVVRFSDCEEIEEKPERYKKKEVQLDPVVTSVMTQLLERSQLGISKYGTTLEDNNQDDFLQHLKEELMDAIIYIEKLQRELKRLRDCK